MVSSDERLYDVIIMTVVNMCVDEGLAQADTLSVVHDAVFGETKKKPLVCDRLSIKSFGLTEGKETSS